MPKDVLRRFSSRVTQSLQKIRFDISADTTVLIAMYHGICEYQSDRIGPWKYAVSPSEFEDQIRYLSKNYEITTPDGLLDEHDHGKSLAVITFDDGYKNNLTNAVPVLEEYEVPATIYISTGFIDGGVPYEFGLSSAIREKESIHISVSGKDLDYDLRSRSSERKAFQEIKQVAKKSPDAREELSEKLSTAGVSVSMLESEEIRELGEHPLVTVGAHGYRHLPLASLSDEILREEIDKCTTDLERILGHKASHFSYPYGSNDETVREVVQNAGYETAVATNPSYIGLQDIPQNKFRLPRFDASFAGVR